MNKKKKWIITAIVLVVFCLILGLYNLLNDKAPASDDAAKAPIAPRRQSTLNVNGRIVRPQRLTDGITTVGNLLPDEEVDLSFETSGKIVAINFQEGTVVRKGELSNARHIAGCRRNKIHLPQVQHAGRVLRISAAIHVRTLPKLYDFIHCLSRQTE